MINENGGEFKGLKRFDARKEIIKALEKRGQFYGEEPNKMSLGICSRSKDIIEPRFFFSFFGFVLFFLFFIFFFFWEKI